MKPELQKLFEGVNGLSTDFLDKVSGILESKVQAARVSAIQETEAVAHQERLSLVEAHQAEIKSLKENMAVDMATTVGKFLDTVVEEWANKNAVSIDNQIKVEAAERMISGLTNVMKESRIHVVADPDGQVADLNRRLSESERQRKIAESDLNTLRESANARAREGIINTVCEGMVDTKREIVVSLLEGIQMTNEEDFKTRVITFRALAEGKKAKKEGDDDYEDKVGKDDEKGDKNLDEGKKKTKKEGDDDEDDEDEDEGEKDDTSSELKESVAAQIAQYRRAKGIKG